MASNQLSKTEQNFFFFAKVSLDIIKPVFVDILTHFVNPYQLLYNTERSKVSKYLFKSQLDLCFPQPPLIPDYSKFDVSLLYILIRQLCPLISPTRRWGLEPYTMHTNIGDDIERLRQVVKRYRRADNTEIPDNEFRTLLSELKPVMHRIHTFTKEWSRHNYAEELLKIESLRFGREDRNMCKYFLRFTFEL